MNKKNLVQLIIIFACFAASAIVIYNNFIKKPELPPELLVQTSAATGEKLDTPILPNGPGFDLGPVKNSDLRFNLLDYPKLKFPDEVGSDETQILKPLQNLMLGNKPN